MTGKVALHTLGCKLNFSETSTIGNQFIKNGFDVVDFKEEADVYLINTCTVTENAEKECRQIVRRALRNNPEAFVIVTGCYAQLRPEQIAEIEGVDLVLGSNEKFKLFSLVENFNKKELACVFVSPTENLTDFGPAFSTDADSRTRAFFKIQDGCDYKCTFCTIPLARGGSRSMNFEDAVIQFQELVERGYKEIILTGVNVGDYENNNIKLYNLLLKFLEIPGEFRIRISSIEPNLLNGEILNLTATHEKMCKHFHIPLQSGSPDILKKMQRRYKREDYAELIYKTKNLIRNVCIGVDVIVGFPGETEEHFLETYNLLKELPISYLHVFTYSERPNTKAIELGGNVSVNERKKRNNMLRILSEKKRFEFYTENLNEIETVLFEGENHKGMMYGFTSNYIKVASPFAEDKINNFSEITINEIQDNYCTVKEGEKKSIVLM